jgi:hypothetical protein
VEHHTKKLENPKPQMTLDRAGSLGYFVDGRDPHATVATLRARDAATEALRKSVVTRGGHVVSRAGASDPHALPKPKAAGVRPAGFGSRPNTSFAGGVGNVVAGLYKLIRKICNPKP